jgi:hypothetical protein
MISDWLDSQSGRANDVTNSRLCLGRLARVELRNIWNSEAAAFTPWLAREENLSVLGETLGLELELEAQDLSAPTFSARTQPAITGSLLKTSWSLRTTAISGNC